MANRLLEDFASIGPDWFWEMDENYRFSYFSSSLAGKIGVSPEQQIGKSRLEIACNAEDEAFWQAHLDDLLSRKPFRDFAYPYRDDSGRRRWIKISGDPIFDADGTFRGYRGSASDFTDEYEAREQLSNALSELGDANKSLEAQNTLFLTAIDNMSQGLCMFDDDGRLIVCNRRYAEMYGLPEELTRPGALLSDILEHRIRTGRFHGDDPDAFLRDRLEMVARDDRCETVDEFANGSVFRIVHASIPNGGTIATHEDITSRRRTQNRIAQMARRDNLTGLPNRVMLGEQLELALDSLAAGGQFALLCLDLDDFKAVNDSLGHPAGDALLMAVARRLLICAGDGDTIARLGGDEFAIVHANSDGPESAGALARRIVEVLGPAFTIEGQQVLIGVSIGIALAPNHGTEAEQLLRHAELALYRAKDAGRRTYRFFEPKLALQLRERRRLEAGLRQALANDEFEIFYQPMVSLSTARISGVEALLRWRTPREGLILPSDFVPICEEVGLIVPLGNWILRQACMEIAQLSDDLCVAVNLSSVQFKHSGIVATVSQALANANLDPSRLELEITESVLLLEREETLTALHQLRDIGVRISMDDFGTGYSSLSYLRRFPFDRIKLDQSFIQGVETDENCKAIVRAVASLGADLGIDTTAEGVETESQLRALINEGLTEVQGYLFSEPAPLSGVRETLAKATRVLGAAA